MRRYDIITGILLILSTIDFTLAAPATVLVQDKRQARVKVVHMPKDVTAVGKRWDEELEKLGEKYFKTGTHSSSSSAVSGPDHGSTNVVQPPARNPANLNPPTEPPCSWSTQGLSARGNCLKGFNMLFDAEQPEQPRPHLSTLPDSVSDYVSPAHGEDSSPESEWEHYPSYYIKPGNPRPKDFEFGFGPNSPKESGQELIRLNLPSTSGQARLPPSTESGPGVHSPSPDAEPKDEAVPWPPPSPDPKLHLDDQSLSGDSQSADLLAALYAKKGIVKESRRSSGIATRDVGNAT